MDIRPRTSSARWLRIARVGAALVTVAALGLMSGPARAAGMAGVPGVRGPVERPGRPTAAAIRTGVHRLADPPGVAPSAPVGADPQTAVLDPASGTLYVDNSSDNTVSMIDTARCNAQDTATCGRAAPTIDIPSGAGALALDPSSHTLYVLGDQVVSMVDVAACNAQHLSGCGRTPSTAPVGQIALSLAVNETTGTLYVGNAGENDLSVIDATTCNARSTTGCGHQRTLHLGNFPGVGAIDEATDTVYVINNGANQQGENDTVSVVNGATCNAHVGSGCGQTPVQVPIGFGDINDSVGVALAPATGTLYVTNGGDNTVSMLDTRACNATHPSGCSAKAATAPVGDGPQGIAVDPASLAVYVANAGDDTVSLLDGATCNATRTSGCARTHGAVRVGLAPIYVTSAAATHTMYVVDIDGRTVSVVNTASCNVKHSNGCTDFPGTVAVGAGPGLMALNNRTHTLYVTNYFDNSVSVIDASTCNAGTRSGCTATAPTVPVGAGPGDVAVNEVTNTAYVANSDGNTISVIDGSSCRASDTSGCGQPPAVMADSHDPQDVAVDQATDSIYVGNADGTISVIDGASCRGGVTTGCGQSPPTIQVGTHVVNDITFNPMTRTVYATTLHDGVVSVINGATCNASVTSGCGQVPPTVAVGLRPLGVRVDERTNTVYVAIIFTATGCGDTVSMFDGATCDAVVTSGCGQSPVILTVGLGPSNLAIDQGTDTVYVNNAGDYSVSLIDGKTCNASRRSTCHQSFPTVQVGGAPDGVEVGETTHTAYVANFNDSDVSMFGPVSRTARMVGSGRPR